MIPAAQSPEARRSDSVERQRIIKLRRIRDRWNERCVDLILGIKQGSEDVGEQYSRAARAYEKAAYYNRLLMEAYLEPIGGEECSTAASSAAPE